jgi:hypothetical protein
MSKFLLNLPLQISKALVNSKIQFLIQKSFFLPFGPANLAARSASGPASPPAAPSPAGRNHPGWPIQPARRSRLRRKYVFLFGSRLPEPTASPSSLYQPGPICQMYLPHCAGRPRLLSSVPYGHPAPPDLVMPGKTITLRLDSPPESHFITSHQAGPSSMALNPLTPVLTATATPNRRSPDPYKRRATSPSFTAPLPAPISLSPRLSSPLTERHHLPVLHRHRQASSAPPELW